MCLQVTDPVRRTSGKAAVLAAPPWWPTDQAIVIMTEEEKRFQDRLDPLPLSDIIQ